jgi:hypothetical protein
MEIFMNIMSKSRLKKRRSNSVKNIISRLDADEAFGKPIDLSKDVEIDDWDDCLDDGPLPSAITRLLNTPKPRIEKAVPGSKKIKRTTPVTKLHRQRQKLKKAPRATSRSSVIGPNSMPEADDKAIQSLWLCNSIDDVIAEHEKWGNRFNDKSLKGISKRKLADDTQTTISAILDGSATDIPVLTNNRMLLLAWQDVRRKLLALLVDDADIEFALVTYISGDGGTSLNAPLIELHHSRSKVLSVTRSMARNFLGVTELAMFNSHRHPDGGRHLQRHEHVLIWGIDILDKAKDVARRRMKEFPPNITDAPQIDVRRVPSDEVNLARICAYLFKAPHKSMNWNPPKGSKNGHMNQSEKGDRNIRYLRMAQIRSSMTIEDVLFAGGQGIAIRSELIKLLRQTCSSEAPSQKRLLHPDEIVAFWAEVNKALNRPEWRVPIIARRP